jgi:hypothetical protein
MDQLEATTWQPLILVKNCQLEATTWQPHFGEKLFYQLWNLATSQHYNLLNGVRTILFKFKLC